mmetsp:Transcript_51609/g.137767  ORF Transcript_51609/g.137767 Transcript_51609/m.137767 type:complete len:278 (-) Transcript_51609:91-924(-)
MRLVHKPTCIPVVGNCGELAHALKQLCGNLAISKTTSLGFLQYSRVRDQLYQGARTQAHLYRVDVVKLHEKPRINVRQLRHSLDGGAKIEGFGDGPDTCGRWLLQLCTDVVKRAINRPMEQLLIKKLRIKSSASILHHSERLLDHLFESAANRHDLSDTLHARAHRLIHGSEFAQVPPGHLGNHVIQRGLEACRGAQSHTVPQFDKVAAQGKFRCNVSKRIPCRLRCQSTAARESRVHLDDPELVTLWIHGVLNVALANDANVANDLQCALSQAIVL